MTTSIFLAQLFGIVLVIKGISIFTKRAECHDLINDLLKHKLMLYVVGSLELVAAVSILLQHNIWEGWPTLITVIAWLMALEAVLILVFPIKKFEKMCRAFVKPGWMTFWGLLALVLGGYFLSVGF